MTATSFNIDPVLGLFTFIYKVLNVRHQHTLAPNNHALYITELPWIRVKIFNKEPRVLCFELIQYILVTRVVSRYFAKVSLY